MRFFKGMWVGITIKYSYSPITLSSRLNSLLPVALRKRRKRNSRRTSPCMIHRYECLLIVAYRHLRALFVSILSLHHVVATPHHSRHHFFCRAIYLLRPSSRPVRALIGITINTVHIFIPVVLFGGRFEPQPLREHSPTGELKVPKALFWFFDKEGEIIRRRRFVFEPLDSQDGKGTEMNPAGGDRRRIMFIAWRAKRARATLFHWLYERVLF